MKKSAILFLCFIAFCATIAHADNEKPIDVSQLPTAAQQLIKQHFPDCKVVFAKVETKHVGNTYEILFSDGNDIEFDNDGNWKEIDCKQSNVPDALVPVRILEYVRNNYPETRIMKIERDRNDYEVKLSNRLELTFDLAFNLIEIDR